MTPDANEPHWGVETIASGVSLVEELVQAAVGLALGAGALWLLVRFVRAAWGTP